LTSLYALPLPELLYRAQSLHRKYHNPEEVQLSTLISIKTGDCPEDCAYCSQSAHYETELASERLMDVDRVLEAARRAKASGSTRLCMGAAWREVREGRQFESVLDMVRGVEALGMESCCTLGMLTESQAQRLADAGLRFYNHNLDTGPDYYGEIVTTRTYEDRLRTLAHVRAAGISVCSGGIIGMGERVEDRMAMLATLASHRPHPESVPINALVPVAGTPLGYRSPVEPLEFARMIAVTRIAMPKSMVRLSAGRTGMSDEAQALCLLAGANSIFTGEKLLTTPNPGEAHDADLLEKLGMRPAGDSAQP
jgi:biotin synthase